VTDPGIASRSLSSGAHSRDPLARNYEKNRKKSSGFPVSDRICLVSDIEPFTNKFSFARMLSITDLVEFVTPFNKLAPERDFENAELSGGESLGLHRGSAPARILRLVGDSHARRRRLPV
jgi:hypothetical protein